MYKLNSLKAQEGIFSSLLNKEKKFVFIKSSSIFIGETKAENILTVFSNPYCYPCAKLHKRILNFITHNENVKIQYIFTCFDDKSSIASKCIISAFFNSKTKERNNVIAQWYKYGKNDIVRFCKNYNVDINDKRVLEEFQKQKEWSDASKLKFTPTILFNGNIMPDIYDIEDLNYLI